MLFVLFLLSQPALADGAPAILSVLAVGGPLAPVFAIVWANKRTKGLSALARWCGLVFSVPAAVGTFNLSLAVVFNNSPALPSDSCAGLSFWPVASRLLCCRVVSFASPRPERIDQRRRVSGQILAHS